MAQRESALAQRECTLAQRESTMAQREAALAQREAALAQREAALAQHESTLTQRETALDAFDSLRFQKVRDRSEETVSSFLATFQSAAADLEPDERIELEVSNAYDDMELFEAVLLHPQANKICALEWCCYEEKDVKSLIPLFINNCPELGLLRVDFQCQSAFGFVSGMLEHPGNKIQVLEMLQPSTAGDSFRFFAALGQSQVSALSLSVDVSPKFVRGLCKYLARDLLVRLELELGNGPVPSKVMVSLAKCTRLAEFKLVECEFSQPTAFTRLPKSITKLTLHYCKFVGGVDWSFLADSNVQELDLCSVEGVDGNQLGSALAVLMKAKGLDTLRLGFCDFAGETLAGVELGRIKRLATCDNLNDASFELIAHTLQSLNSDLQELEFLYEDDTTSSIENHLVPALKHPNCSLAKLKVLADPAYEAAAKTLEDRFCNRLALLALLQGQQVRRLYCPLRRLPVEVFRMVGMVLL